MKHFVQVGSFKKDYKRAQKRGKNIEKLSHILATMLIDGEIPARHKLHKLTGNYAGHWELHIEPDWLLIFRYEGDAIILTRTGTHSDLFK